MFKKNKYIVNNNTRGVNKVTIADCTLILIVLIEICEKIMIVIPHKNTLILKFLNLSLLLDLRITNDATIHNMGIYSGNIVLL